MKLFIIIFAETINSMKRLFSIIVVMVLSAIVMAGAKKKVKILDHYFIDDNNVEVDLYDAKYEIKVFQDADSIVVYTWLASTEIPASVETFRILNDSVQEKWGTQLTYYNTGQVRRYQFIDRDNHIDTSINYTENGLKESETIVNRASHETQASSWYPSGAKKSLSKSERNAKKQIVTNTKSWHENGMVARDHYSVNHVTEKLKVYDNEGRCCLSIPCQQGDTIFMTSKGSVASPKEAKMHGVVKIDGDSIKIKAYSLSGRILSEENFMSFSPEHPVYWGMQRYYYTTTSQPVDSVVQFKAVNGINLIEKQYYPDGNPRSVSTVTYDKVMNPTTELRQYYQSGKLRRIQKHLGDKLIEGHCYDSDGNEITFYEFNE